MSYPSPPVCPTSILSAVSMSTTHIALISLLLCLLLFSSCRAALLDLLPAICGGDIPPHHLLAGFAEGMQVSQVPRALQDPQGSQEPCSTLGPSVASKEVGRNRASWPPGPATATHPKSPTASLLSILLGQRKSVIFQTQRAGRA